MRGSGLRGAGGAAAVGFGVVLVVLVGLVAPGGGAGTRPVAGAVAEAVAWAGTPASGLPAVPDPAECSVAPRSLDSVRAVLGEPPAADVVPSPESGDAPADGSASDSREPAAAAGDEPGEPDRPGPPLPIDQAAGEAPVPVDPEAGGEPPEPVDPSRGGEPEPIDPELGGEPPVPVGIALPTGEPADPATVAAVTATVRRFVACANARDVGRMYALVSDAFLRQSFGNQPTTEAVAAYLAATPPARPADQRTELVAVRSVRVLADGRIGALVDDRDPTDPRTTGVSTDWVVLVEFATEGDTDGRGHLLFDEVVSGVDAFSGPEATPAP